ncbi:MBL fold metallo-hydrolase [Polaromonas sp.]|uniref:MBL fold metallo-hydrolase n=1 Tax=Polaromonas sp. TaxID=1869339 RepID=UPI003753ABC1
MNPSVESFFDPATWTISHVAYQKKGSACAIIDPVLDYDPKAGRTLTVAADRLIAFIRENKLRVDWILETHAHADHLSAAQYLRRELGGKIAIAAAITKVQKVFARIFHLEPAFRPDGHQFDKLLLEGEKFAIGALVVEAMSVPGHTPACMAYRIGDAVFVGDTLFMPDVGTARCDFPGGDAHSLFRSMRKLLDLPADTRLFMCHDYPPEGRPPAWQSSVAAQRAANIHVHDGIGEEAFVTMRNARDATLEMPVLILPAVQINIRAGEMPPAESNGVSYLKVPLDTL